RGQVVDRGHALSHRLQLAFDQTAYAPGYPRKEIQEGSSINANEHAAYAKRDESHLDGTGEISRPYKFRVPPYALLDNRATTVNADDQQAKQAKPDEPMLAQCGKKYVMRL